MAKLTLRGIQREACSIGMRIRRTGWGKELVVVPAGKSKNDPVAYFTDDYQDAIDTARYMVRELAKGANVAPAITSPSILAWENK